MTKAPIAKKWICDLAPYVPGRAKADGTVKTVKLSANESLFGASPRALHAYQSAASELFRYSDGNAFALREAIAEIHALEVERIICGAGSDDILTLLIHAYAGCGDEVIHSRFGFMLYPIQTQAAGAKAVAVPNKNWAADVDGILRHVTEKTKIVFIDNPNNPTGAYLPFSEIERLQASLPPHVILCLDAAYAECVTASDYQAGEILARKSNNVIMTRTFSKLYGLAGLRVGWAYGAPEIIDILNRTRLPFNVSLPGAVAAIEAVKDQDFLKKAVAFTLAERDYLASSLMALGLEVVPSQTNFILFGLPDEKPFTAEEANAYLSQHGFLLRWIKGQGLDRYLRLSVGLPEQNRAFIDLMRAFLSAEGR